MQSTSEGTIMTRVTLALVAIALLVPTCGWAEETDNSNEELLFVSAIFTGNWSAFTATVAEEDTEVEKKTESRPEWLKISSWLSWGGTYDGENEGAINSTRLRVDAELSGGFSATWEHDFASHVNGRAFTRPSENDLKYALVKWSGNLPKGGKITFAGGQHLDSVAFLYPSPATLPTTQYPITLDGYGIYSKGAAIWLEGDFATLRANYDTENERSAISLSTGPVSLFWDNRHGFGLMARHNFSRWVNLEAGFDQHEQEGESWQERGFLQYHANLSESLRAYARWDENFEQDETSWLGGITWEYLPVSFIKLYWEEGADDGNLAAQVTYSHKF
jgi:hypothetical protein